MKTHSLFCRMLSMMITILIISIIILPNSYTIQANADTGVFRTYDLSETELQKIASLCVHEQPTHKGRAAEASLMANIYDLRGITNKSLYEFVRTCGWWANSKAYMDEMCASEEDVENIRKVLCEGKRIIPAYVNEHDYIGDIEVVTNYGKAINKKNSSEYIQYVSQIKQLDSHFDGSGITYTYYCHPDKGCDPFGYTSENNRTALGEAYYDFDTWILINGSNPPQNVVLDKNQYWYDIEDTVELYPSADNANRFYMAIYKNDTVVRDGWITGTYSIAASELGYGDYVVWVTAANSAGTADSNHLEIPIVGAPGYTGVHTTMPLYSLNDTVSISVDTVCAKGAVIGIDRNGVERAVTEGCNKGIGTYEIAASSLGVGDYSAYFSVYNGSGSIDTERVSFKIYDSAPSISVLSANKTEITVGEEITFTASSDCATGYTMGIDDVNGRYLTPDMNNGELTLSFDKPGNYSAYVTSYNSIGYCDSQRIEISVYSVKPVSGDCNNDGEFNVADVILLQKWLLAVPDTHFENWKAADMCEDGRLDVFDLCMMKRKLIYG